MSIAESLIHVSLNTGRVIKCRQETLSPLYFESLQALLHQQVGPIPGMRNCFVVWSCRDGLALIIFCRPGIPLAVGGLAWGSGEAAWMWGWLGGFADAQCADFSRWGLLPPPDRTPWLATVLLPALQTLSIKEALSLRKFSVFLGLALVRHAVQNN
jgi:hypothetical protein